MERLPLAIRDVSPGPSFVRPEPRCWSDGLPEGIHTGGVWISPDGLEFWKPLDGRPHVAADCHYPTQEAAALGLMAGAPGFPRNWRVAERGTVEEHGHAYTRRWLVRRRAYPLPCEDVPANVERHARPIEQGLRLLNQRGWTIGDRLSVAYDADLGVPFVLDLSCAGDGLLTLGSRPVDEDRFLRWAEEMGFTDLVRLRQVAREMAHPDTMMKDPCWPRRPAGTPGLPVDTRYRHIYASRHRPMDAGWARIPGAYFKPADYDQLQVHTWVIVPAPLDDVTTQQYQLDWAWSPL